MCARDAPIIASARGYFMRPFFIVLATALALGGCRSTPETVSVVTAAAFDANEASFIKKPGKTSIHGHAFWRDDKGGTINAAGEIIRLVPATRYARERFASLYKGQRSLPADQIPRVDVDPQYAEFTRTTRAESTGRFEFDNVAPGEYFVTAQVRYRDRDAYLQMNIGSFHQRMRTGNDGGAMFETVTVSGKEEKPIKLVVTNDR